MNKKKPEYNYSNDEILKEAISLVKKGKPEKEIQTKLHLSDSDMDLIDFVINEL